jgi:hypothetical protein
MQSKRQQSWSDEQTANDALDRTLDAELGKYSAVEPRAGLERRVLAQLRSAEEKVPRARWRLTAIGALAALIVIAAVFGWESSRPTKMGQTRLSVPVEVVPPSKTQVAGNVDVRATIATRPRHKATQHQVYQPIAVAGEPKLDQFPSPEPLTEEELALVRYVRRFPGDALLVARAEEEFEKELRQESLAGRPATPEHIQEER